MQCVPQPDPSNPSAAIDSACELLRRALAMLDQAGILCGAADIDLAIHRLEAERVRLG